MFWTLLWILAGLAFAAFACVVAFGAPFLPTLKKQTVEALDLLDLKPGQTLVELGSGDGRILREAAKRGIYGIGYELNPFLVWWTMVSNIKYRRYITVRWANYWRKPLPETDGIYTFLLAKYMSKLDTKITQDMKLWPKKKPLKLVSFAFEVPDKKPAKEQNGLRLYKY